MRAIVFEKHGGPEVTQLKDVPIPKPGPHEVLVEVKASACNPNEHWMRQGIKKFELPLLPGSDAAGIVREVGEHVTQWKPGDEVLAYCGMGCHECYRCLNGEEHICMQDGGFQSCVAYALFAKGARDRGRKSLIECQFEQKLPVIKFLKQTGESTRSIYGCSLLLEEVLGEGTQRINLGCIAFPN